jgi:hypothetical protein
VAEPSFLTFTGSLIYMLTRSRRRSIENRDEISIFLEAAMIEDERLHQAAELKEPIGKYIRNLSYDLRSNILLGSL